MAPPVVRKRGDVKDDSKDFDGDFFQYTPIPISIIILISVTFFWVRVISLKSLTCSFS